MDDPNNDVVAPQFAVIPEAVLFSEVSNRAVRLYAFMQAHPEYPADTASLATLLRCTDENAALALGELKAANFLRWEHGRYRLLAVAFTTVRRAHEAHPAGGGSAPPSVGPAEALMARNRAVREGKACEQCYDTGWRYTPAMDAVEECDHQERRPGLVAVPST